MARGRFKKPKPLASYGSGVNTTLPTPTEDLRRFTEYVAAQENRAKLLLKHDNFTGVVGAIDQAYESFRDKNEGVTPDLARICIVCHQCLFAAAAAIFRGNPHDAAGPSRRATEAARTALALMADPENGKRWLAYEERMSRWSARNSGTKPPKLRINYTALNGDLLADALAKFGGILSDVSLHFTPELLSRVHFQPQKAGRRIHSEYLETEESELANHLGFLAAIHFLILKALDRCTAARLSKNVAFLEALEGVAASFKLLKETHPFQLPPGALEHLIQVRSV
jgi:hypothetical protein